MTPSLIEAAAPDVPGAPVPWKLLLVEDNEGDVQLLREALAESGAEADLTAASTLDEALTLATSGAFELLLLDLGLSDSSGMDTLRAVRRALPDLPVVVMTGLNDEVTARRALDEGAQDYLIKGDWFGPSGSRAMLRSLEYAVGRHRTLTALRDSARIRMMFMASASHELRTPITIIRDYAWLLSDGTTGPLAPPQRECVEAILRNCGRLGALVSDLLDATKLESGNIPMKIESTRPDVLLRQCHADFARICQAKRQRFELDVADDLPSILCDRLRLTQVVVNLLANANRFTPEGGTITLRARVDAANLRIEVQDSGVGISADDQQVIFDAFVQVDRRSGPGPQGTGLGLYIAKRIVAMHGGAITVVSRRDGGSVFTVTVPALCGGSELAGLQACVLACSAPGTAADLVPRAHTVIWLHLPLSSTPGDEWRSRLRTIETTANALFRRHDSAFFSEQDQTVACLIEGTEPEAHGYLCRLDAALGTETPGLRYAIVPVCPSSPQASAARPPMAMMRLLSGAAVGRGRDGGTDMSGFTG